MEKPEFDGNQRESLGTADSGSAVASAFSGVLSEETARKES